MLDAEELLHLALKEMQEGSTEKAIAYLKTCLQQNPNNANAQYLIGALHAELGMYERAAQEMELALTLDPELHTGRFQLGLLHITSGNIEKAKEIWFDLVKLGKEHPLYLFKEGMLDLADNEFEACIEKLKKGIASNAENDALNNDMLNMIARAEEALKQTGGATTAEQVQQDETKSTTQAQSKVSLTAYESENDSDTH